MPKHGDKGKRSGDTPEKDAGHPGMQRVERQEHDGGAPKKMPAERAQGDETFDLAAGKPQPSPSAAGKSFHDRL